MHNTAQIHNAEKPPIIPKEIREFLEDLLMESGVVDVDKITREVMIEELYVRLDKFLFTKIYEFIPKDKTEEFSKLSSNPAQKPQLEEFILKNVNNAEDIFTQAFGEFREKYLKNLEETKKTIAQL